MTGLLHMTSGYLRSPRILHAPAPISGLSNTSTTVEKTNGGNHNKAHPFPNAAHDVLHLQHVYTGQPSLRHPPCASDASEQTVTSIPRKHCRRLTYSLSSHEPTKSNRPTPSPVPEPRSSASSPSASSPTPVHLQQCPLLHLPTPSSAAPPPSAE